MAQTAEGRDDVFDDQFWSWHAAASVRPCEAPIDDAQFLQAVWQGYFCLYESMKISKIYAWVHTWWKGLVNKVNRGMEDCLQFVLNRNRLFQTRVSNSHSHQVREIYMWTSWISSLSCYQQKKWGIHGQAGRLVLWLHGQVQTSIFRRKYVFWSAAWLYQKPLWLSADNQDSSQYASWVWLESETSMPGTTTSWSPCHGVNGAVPQRPAWSTEILSVFPQCSSKAGITRRISSKLWAASCLSPDTLLLNFLIVSRPKAGISRKLPTNDQCRRKCWKDVMWRTAGEGFEVSWPLEMRPASRGAVEEPSKHLAPTRAWNPQQAS